MKNLLALLVLVILVSPLFGQEKFKEKIPSTEGSILFAKVEKLTKIESAEKVLQDLNNYFHYKKGELF